MAFVIHSRLAEIIKKELNIDVVAGCDFNDEIRERFHKECPDAMVTADENEFLSYDMDAVLVATFFTAHADHAIKALEAGYHVMSEVTSFFTPADGVRLVEAVEKSGKIYNLLENAAKFARPGTALYLGVFAMEGKVRVIVRNLGETIPAEELPLLFERFHKSDKSRSEDKDGVGLGLYIVKTILEQHKEKINVTSEDGVTTFSFSLSTE